MEKQIESYQKTKEMKDEVKEVIEKNNEEILKRNEKLDQKYKRMMEEKERRSEEKKRKGAITFDKYLGREKESSVNTKSLQSPSFGATQTDTLHQPIKDGLESFAILENRNHHIDFNKTAKRKELFPVKTLSRTAVSEIAKVRFKGPSFQRTTGRIQHENTSIPFSYDTAGNGLQVRGCDV